MQPHQSFGMQMIVGFTINARKTLLDTLCFPVSYGIINLIGRISPCNRYEDLSCDI